MTGWSMPTLRAWLALSVCLIGLAALILAARPSAPPPVPTAADGPDVPVRVLQMNLCDSGLAGCYTGRSVPEAAAVMRAMAPDLVTVNEVCRDDLPTLQRALIDGASASAVVVFVFQPALDRRTGGAYRCR